VKREDGRKKGRDHNSPAIRLYFNNAFSITDRQYGSTGELAIIFLKVFNELKEAIVTGAKSLAQPPFITLAGSVP
jgi:hypothetical protein